MPLADAKNHDKPTVDHRLDTLSRELQSAWKQIRAMQASGGFADSMMISRRSARIEARLEKVEFDGEMLKDVASRTQGLLEDHLRDRHNALLDRDDDIDVRNWRWIRNRMKVWFEKRGLLDKRQGANPKDESRLRSQTAHS